jgi:hypothetical protein
MWRATFYWICGQGRKVAQGARSVSFIEVSGFAAPHFILIMGILAGLVSLGKLGRYVQFLIPLSSSAFAPR